MKELLKTHWKTILLTSVITILAVGTIGLIAGMYSANQNPATLAQTSQTVEKDLKIKGNRASKIYHLSGCPNYDDIAERHIVWFRTHEEAKAAGYRMAKNC